MRTALIVGRKHGSKKLEVVELPSTVGAEVHKTIASFKEQTASGESKQWELLELWTSDGGVTKRRKLIKPKPKPSPEDKPKPEGKPDGGSDLFS